MCDCIIDTEKRLKKHLGDSSQSFPEKMRPKKAVPGEPASVVERTAAFRFGEKKTTIIHNVVFLARWNMENGKRKETSINVIMSYCPFCGQSLESNT